MTALVVAEGLLLLLAAGPAASRVLPDHVPHCEGERRYPRLIQNVLRRPAEFTGAPPTIGPAALDSPDTLPAPRSPAATRRGPAGNVFVVVYDIAAGFSSTRRRACSARNAMSRPRPGETATQASRA